MDVEAAASVLMYRAAERRKIVLAVRDNMIADTVEQRKSINTLERPTQHRRPRRIQRATGQPASYRDVRKENLHVSNMKIFWY
jgi:hypothetical protein